MKSKPRIVSFTIGADVSCYADLQVELPKEVKDKDVRAWIIAHADEVSGQVSLEPTWESFGHRLVLAEYNGKTIAEGVPLDTFASNVPVSDLQNAIDIMESCDSFLVGFHDDEVQGSLPVELSARIGDIVRILKSYAGGVA